MKNLNLLITFLLILTFSKLCGQTNSIFGQRMMCKDDRSGQSYSSQYSFASYLWSINGGTITSNTQARTVTVNWDATGNHSLSLITTGNPGDEPCIPEFDRGNISLIDNCGNPVNNPINLSVMVLQEGSLSINNSSDHGLCPGNNSGSSTASITSPAIFLRWEKRRNDGTYTTVTTNETLSYSNLSNSTTYRAVAKVNGNQLYNCGTITRSFYVSILPQVTAGLLSGSRTVYSGVVAEGKIKMGSGGNNSNVQRWERKVDHGQWTPIGNSGKAEYSYNRVYEKETKYRLFMRNACGSSDYSNEVILSVVNQSPHYIKKKAFDNNGLFSENITYFDLMGKALQSQSKGFSDNIILINHPIKDRFDRVVGNTLTAPLGTNNFNYKENFIQNSSGSTYSAQDVGQPIGNSEPYTLGWYYSARNTLEDNVPITAYPYSLKEYYNDGSGEVKRSGSPGEALRIGSGHEVYSRSFGVSSELDDYSSRRNQALGLSTTNSLANQTVQNITIDQNGRLSVTFYDKNENVLVSGIAESSATNLNSKPSYTLKDASYNFYDNAGRLRYSISPNGLDQWKSRIPFDKIDKTTYTYNHQGWLLEIREPDAGTAIYLYRRDGSIRFSQNSKQEENLDFSYTDYDMLGRPIESGEVDVIPASADDNFEFQFFNPNANPDTDDIVQSIDQMPNFSANKLDWVETYYDMPDGNPIPNIPSTLVQDFVMGAVSWTRNEHITTWYSYDEQGRVTWMAQKPSNLNRTFLIKYDYDFLGNVLKVGYRSYGPGSPSDEFYHYYTYDADKRLKTVYTSLNGSISYSSLSSHADAQIQAHYEYYLHGPLKRIELGGDMQGIDFVYDINGWLKSINNPDDMSDESGFMDDAFSSILNYYNNNNSNLFEISQFDPSPNANSFHGLPSDLNQSSMQVADLIKMYKPFVNRNQRNESIKDVSAENPVYKEKLLKLKEEREGGEG